MSTEKQIARSRVLVTRLQFEGGCFRHRHAIRGRLPCSVHYLIEEIKPLKNRLGP